MSRFTSRFTALALLFLPAARVLPADTPAADAPPADVAAKLADTQDKLATALHSYEQLQHENDRLKEMIAGLRSELDQLRQPAAAPAESSDLAKQLAETEDKLSTALRSYSLLDAENDRLKAALAKAGADAAKDAADAQAAAAKTSAGQAARLSSVYDELRQTRAQLAALSAENAGLRTRLALAAPAPGGSPPPSRPGRAVSTAGPAARTHIVVAGDTLAGISQQYYGTPDRWADILRANHDVLEKRGALPLGATLRIP